MQSSREAVEGIYKSLDSLFSVIEKTFNFIGLLRNCPIDSEMLSAIEMYIKYFRQSQSKIPDVFIFGHTHVPGQATTIVKEINDDGKTLEKNIIVYNTGSFLKKPKTAGSFMVINDQLETEKVYNIYKIDDKGQIDKMAF